MSRMSELIYPDAPGFKVSGPSERAAQVVGGAANKMRAGARRKNESGMTATVWQIAPQASPSPSISEGGE